ncbi:efflux RND transporter permease subunit [bacterium]|nr:efflux RND transporter permease subunit [bacterium]
MSITEAAIKYNRVTLTMLLIVVIGGLIAYTRMERREDPAFTVRTALVVTYFPGGSPERVEMLVTDKLEKVIQEIPEIDYLESESKTGLSVIHVNIREEYSQMRPIWDRLRRKVEKAAPDLPSGVIGPLVDDEFGDVYGVIISITGEGFSYAELKDVADQTRNDLLHLDDVAKVEILGAQQERIFVEYNNARLSELHLSSLQLKQMLESRNILIPGGSVMIGDERLVVEPSGNFESLDELRKSVISVPGSGQLLTLEDIATVRRGYIDPPQSLMHADGTRCLGLAVSMRDGGNILNLGRQVQQVLDRLQGQYPWGVQFGQVVFEPQRVKQSVDGFVLNLIESVLLVLVVMLLSLGLRTGVLVASLIPMTILTTFLVMYYLGIGLDKVSLAAMIISLGLLVDNAIVMSEAIMVKIEAGHSAMEAAVKSARELRVPLLNSTLTTCASFLPIFLAKSVTGEYTASLFKVVSISLLASWTLALTLIPLLCVHFLKVKTHVESTERFSRPFYRRYRGLLLTLLRRPLVSLGGFLVLFILSMASFVIIPKIFFPPNSTPLVKIMLDLPVGTAIESTERTVSGIETFMQEELSADPQHGKPGVTGWGSFIGQGMPRFVLTHHPKIASPEYADILVRLSDYDFHEQLAARIDSFCRANYPDLEVRVKPLENGPPIDHPVQYRISGRDYNRIFALAEQVKDRLAGLEGTRNISDDWGSRAAKLLVRIDEPRALRAGVSNQDIAVSLLTHLSGFQTTEYREGDKVIPVTLRSAAAGREDIDRIETLSVYSQMTGMSVPLRQVADIEVAWEPAHIVRRDRYRTVTVQCDLAPGMTASRVNAQMVPWLEQQRSTWELGYGWELGGEAETSGKSQNSVLDQLPLAGFIILMLLVLQFNSFRKPLIILSTIPLGMIGVIIGLLAMHSYFGFMTLLGAVSLSGIVVNIAIVLLDRIDLEHSSGLELSRAVVDSAQHRIRPILLSTLTTVGGIAPLYFGGDVIFKPMAVALMFGLLFSTLLTLGLLPVLYALLYRLDYKHFDY